MSKHRALVHIHRLSWPNHANRVLEHPAMKIAHNRCWCGVFVLPVHSCNHKCLKFEAKTNISPVLAVLAIQKTPSNPKKRSKQLSKHQKKNITQSPNPPFPFPGGKGLSLLPSANWIGKKQSVAANSPATSWCWSHRPPNFNQKKLTIPKNETMKPYETIWNLSTHIYSLFPSSNPWKKPSLRIQETHPRHRLLHDVPHGAGAHGAGAHSAHGTGRRGKVGPSEPWREQHMPGSRV